MSIDYELSDGIATITINRPEKANALDADHYAALSECWKQVRDNPDVRVAIVTGAGERSFCAGADLKSYIGQAAPLRDLWLTQKDQLLNRGLEVWKPVIAAVNGACMGGGMTLLFATDMRVCADTATFGLSEVKRGVIAANGGTQRLLHQLPYAIGMEMLLTGDPMDATTAERWGLVNRVVPQQDLMHVARDLALRISANAPLAVQAAKELAIRGRDSDISHGLRMEQMVNALLKSSDDCAEGRAAFAEKRPPKFEGR